MYEHLKHRIKIQENEYWKFNLYIYIFRVTLSVISMGENSCLPYCGYRFKYLGK